jgi:hypothetical protein
MIARAPLADLSPLHGMNTLGWLDVVDTNVTDLTPLRGMRLEYLGFPMSPLKDIGPLRNVTLTDVLNLDGTRVKDLSPLRGQRLRALRLQGVGRLDLEALRGMRLETLAIDFDAAGHKDVLKSLKDLRKINGQPVEVFWAEIDRP